MQLITEKEYRDFVNQRKKINELILAKTTQLSLLIYNRIPRGDCVDYDFDEEDGKIIVQFEEWHCGEPDYDTFKLTLEFLFDETYPEKYKIIFEEEKRKKEEEKRIEKEREEENKRQRKDAHERSEYERLKLKFEASKSD